MSEEAIVFQNRTYFKVKLDLLRVETPIPFPLFIHFVVNERAVLRFKESQVLTEVNITKYRGMGLEHFICPEEFREQWEAYLRGPEFNENKRDGAPDYSKDQILADLSAHGIESIADLLENQKLSKEEKKAMLTGIGVKMVGILASITDGSAEERKEAFNECKAITDDIVKIAMQSHEMRSVYEDLLMLYEGDIEHSTAVSTIAVIFSLALGFVENDDLAEISMAGLLHDLGHSQMDIEMLQTPYDSHGEAESAEFFSHPEIGADLLDAIGEEITPTIKMAILQHHEHFDGNGFPHKLQGHVIDERVQILSIADKIDDLMSGRINGSQTTPIGAVEILRKQMRPDLNKMLVSPDVFEPLYQTILNTMPEELRDQHNQELKRGSTK